jgi:MFS family permease
VLLLPLLGVRSPGDLWLVYVVQFLEQAAGQFFMPAKGALVPHLVAQRDLAAANALDELAHGAGRLLGPPLGGALLALVGFHSVVLLDAASFVGSALLLALIAVPATAPHWCSDTAGAAPSFGALCAAVWREWVAGQHLVRGQRALVTLLGLNGLVMVGYGIIFVLLVVFVRDVRWGGPLELAWLATAQGAGGLLGGAAVGHFGHTLPPGRLFAAGAGAAGIGFLAAFHAPMLPLVLGCLALAGAGVAGVTVGARTLQQSASTDAYLGRVLATYGTVSALLMLVGQGLAGALAAPLGVVATLDLAGALYLGAAAGGALLLPHAGAILDDRVAASEPNGTPLHADRR